MKTRQSTAVSRRLLTALAPGLLVLLAAGCASQPVKREPAIFFPPAPALPRLQFLTSFNGLKDIEEQSGFDRFVVGEKLNLELDKPYGVAMHDGKIYVCDTNTTVIVLDLKKKLFSSMAGAVGPGRLSQPVKREPAIFFPPAPALPRLQFLTSFNGLKDIEEQSGFDRFVVGEKLNLELDKPYGVAMYDGKIYVCDTNTTVIVLDLKKKLFSSMTGAVGPGRLSQPVNISIEPDGTKYVTDPVRGQVVVFDKDDAYLRAIGEPGTWKPVDAVPFGDRLYVADNANGLVKVFDKLSGELLKTIGDKGDPAERLDRPTNISFDAKGNLYVTDIGRFQIVKFDRDGHFQSMIGKVGDTPGHFARPKGTAIDRNGLLYAADAAFNNVQIFNSEGRLLMFFGDAGLGPGGLMLPAKVAIDEQNVAYFRSYAAPEFEIEYLVLVTSQFGERKVSVYGFGHEKGKRYPTEEELRQQIEERRKKELEKIELERQKSVPPAAPAPASTPEKPPVSPENS